MLKYLSDDGENDEKSYLIEQYKNKIKHLEYRVSYLEHIAKISQTLNSTLELEPLLKTITQVATELTNTEACSILLYDKASKKLKFMPSTSSVGTNKLLTISVPLEGSIAGWVFKKGRPMLIRDVKTDKRWNQSVDDESSFVTRSILGAPLKIKQDTIGVLELLNKKDDIGFTQDDIQIATTLAAQVAVAIENARLWKDVQKAYKDLQELDDLKTQFVSLASHELRTPLAVILGYATFLRDEVSGQASEQLEQVLSSAVKLRNLIDDMVNLRHIKKEDTDLDVTIFSMKKLVQDAISEFDNLLKAKALKVKVSISEKDDPINFEGDRQKIYLVVANLLSNAVKFTPEAGSILVALGRKGQKIILKIADTGVGIPEAEYHKIFEAFYQVEPVLTRRYDGMGLGLSIVKGMVDIHKGSVKVESVPNKGSQFTITLPISVDLSLENV